MRTSQNMSPLTLWDASIMTCDPHISIYPEQYGIDIFGPIPINEMDDRDEGGIIVPEITPGQFSRLQAIDFLVEDGNHGINNFTHALNFIETME